MLTVWEQQTTRGEFGRTPRINNIGGRDHWPAVMSCLLAGGGLRTGQVIGSSGPRGEEPRGRPCSVQTILSTVYHVLGIDPTRTFQGPAGRPLRLLDNTGPVKDLV